MGARNASGEHWGAWLRRLGESMRELRRSLDLSQEELASRAGLSQGSLSRFENGCNGNIGALVILKLGAALARECHGPREFLLSDAIKGVVAEFVRLGGPTLASATSVRWTGPIDGVPGPRASGAWRQAGPATERNFLLREQGILGLVRLSSQDPPSRCTT
jgi:DNA-binding XRE family transcriptional regulator